MKEVSMKAFNRFSIILVFGALVLLNGCGKDKETSTSNNTAPATGYYILNNTCYDSLNQPVAMTYCQGGVGTNGYVMTNCVCYNSASQQVAITNCVSTAAPTPTSCYGTYCYVSNQGVQRGTCNGSNCAGYDLYTQTGQYVRCQ